VRVLEKSWNFFIYVRIVFHRIYMYVSKIPGFVRDHSGGIVDEKTNVECM